jgi:hypothetical protein
MPRLSMTAEENARKLMKAMFDAGCRADEWVKAARIDQIAIEDAGIDERAEVEAAMEHAGKHGWIEDGPSKETFKFTQDGVNAGA